LEYHHYVEIYSALSLTAGVAHAVHAVMSVRSPEGAAAWAVALVCMPVVSIPLYWIFGRNKFRGYLRIRKADAEHLRGSLRRHVKEIQKHKADLPREKGSIFSVLESLTFMPCLNGNSVEIFTEGRSAFSSMLAAVSAAKSYVLLEFFIVEDGVLGEEFKTALAKVAAKGVKVLFIYDEIGSRKLSKKYASELEAAGVTLKRFNSSKGSGNKLQLNFRNHRKITVIDGKTAFLGGLNLADEYIGKSREFSSWRDTHTRVEGPAALAVQLAFLEDWRWAADADINFLTWSPHSPPGASHRVMIIPSGPADEQSTCQMFTTGLFNYAKRRIWIASPYFVPDAPVVASLKLAVLRGVDVRVILPQNCDHYLVYLAGRSYFEDVIRAGVRIYMYQDGFMHQKVMLIDEDFSTIGTMNLDNRSFYLNFEITALSPDKSLAREVASMLERDMKKCREAAAEEIREYSFAKRALMKIARLMSPVL
jgi:cardiolipin synthase